MARSRKFTVGVAVVVPIILIAAGWVLLTMFGAAAPPIVADLDGLDPAVATRIRELIVAVERAPRAAAERGHLGMAYQANDLRKAALASFEQAVRLEPSQPKWWYYLACSRSLLGDVSGALGALDEAIALADEYVPAHWRRGELLMARGDLADAEAAFQGALAIRPGEPAAQVGLVRVDLQRRENGEALTLLGKLLRRYPNHPYLYHLLARTYRQMGRYDEMREALARSRPGEPRWSDPWLQELDQYRVGFSAEFKKALRLIAAGDRLQAISMLEGLREQRSDDVTLLINLGAAYVGTRQYAKAVSTLKAALVHSPDHFGAHLNLSGAYERLKRYDDALHHVELAIEHNPTLSQAHLQRGALLIATGRLDEALEAFAEARRYSPGDITGLINSGWVECRRERWPAAASWFEKAIGQDAASAPALYGLAYAKMGSGRLDEAQAALEKAERVNPGNPQYQAFRRRLAQLRRDKP